MKYIVVGCFILFCGTSAFGQNNWFAPYAISLTATTPFISLEEETDQLALSFEAQAWPSFVLEYTLTRLQQNPYLVSAFYIDLTIVSPDQSKRLVIPVPVNERYIRAFRTEEGFHTHYVAFLSDTYDWILSRL